MVTSFDKFRSHVKEMSDQELDAEAERIAGEVEKLLDEAAEQADTDEKVACVYKYHGRFDSELFGRATKLLLQRFRKAGWGNVAIERVGGSATDPLINFLLQPPE